MPTIHITKTNVEKLETPLAGRVDYFDDKLKGFGVRVSPAGKIFFVMRRVNGKLVRSKIDAFGTITVEVAKKRAEGVLADMGRGIDPNKQKQAKIREEEARRLDPSVNDLVTEYMEKHSKVKKKTWAEDQRCLEKEVVARWGKLKAKEIRRRDVKLLLQEIVDRGAPIQANNTFEKIRKMFNYAIEHDIIEFSPCFGVKMPSKKTQKDRVLSEDEINIFWYCLDRAGMSDEIKRALKLILITGQRPGEVIGMHSGEIDGRWWNIPAHRAKNGKGHRVYLTDFALELIGNKQGYVFESPKGDKSMENNAVACAVRRSLANGKLTMQSWTPHDLRRTTATGMSILGFSDEIIDAILNHTKKGVIGIYNRNKYDHEKQTALACWSCKLSSIITGKDAGCSKCPASQKKESIKHRGQVVPMQAMVSK